MIAEVAHVPSPPVVVSPIADVTVDEDAVGTAIELANVFQDPGDTLTYTVSVSPAAAAVVDRVSQAHYTHLLEDRLFTHDGDDRGFGPEHDLARQNIVDYFEYVGLDTTLEPFWYAGKEYFNVVGVKPGTVRPHDIYLVGAHFDSVDNPGADDNASGVAAIMEIARALAPYEFECTIAFVSFDREELGHYGSLAYASAHAGDHILGMVNLDMIAFNAEGNRQNAVRLYDYVEGGAIKSHLAAAFALYGDGVWTIDGGQSGYSDHKSFELQGFDAAWIAERRWEKNPYKHAIEDAVETPDYLDYEFATKITAATAGYLVTAAGLVDSTSLLTAGLQGDTLTLDYRGDQNGTVDVTVRATDAMGAWVDDTFTVRVNPVDDAPEVTSPIANVIAPDDATDTRIDLTGAFDDPDVVPGGEVLAFSLAANTNPALVTTRFHGDDLILSRVAGPTGWAEITVRATDSAGLSVEDTFIFGTMVVPEGTPGDDVIEVFPASLGSWIVRVNGVEYPLSSETGEIDGLEGRDTLIFAGTETSETVELWPDHAVLRGEGCTVTVANVETINAYGGGGDDLAVLRDSPAADDFTARAGWARMSGLGFTLTVSGFPTVLALASDDGRTDTAILTGLAGSKDRFRSWATGESNDAKVWGPGFLNRVKGFDRVKVGASDPSDLAELYDSPGDDTFEGYADRGTMTYATGASVQANHFRSLFALASGDAGDTARLYDTTAGPGTSYATWFKAYAGVGKMYDGSAFYNVAKGFPTVVASATGNDDTARLYDSAGADAFDGYADLATMTHADGSVFHADDFRTVLAYASDDGQIDTAGLYDTTADLGTAYASWYKADDKIARMYSGVVFENYAVQFDRAIASASGGDDWAKLYDSAASDVYGARPDQARMEYADGTFVEARDFRYALGYSRYGSDTATFYDETSGDASLAVRFGGYDTWSKFYGTGFYSSAEGFGELRAAFHGGDDLAWVFDDATRVDHLLVPFAGDAGHAAAKAKFWNDRRAIYVDDFDALTAATSEDFVDDKDVDPAYAGQVILDGNWAEA